MTRSWLALHGHPNGRGVTWRNRPRCWIVKFKRNRKSIYIGSFYTLRTANAAAEEFLNQEATPLCPPPSPATATPTVKPSSTRP